MIHEKDIFDNLGPGGEPERLEPESGKQHSSFMITGRVFDHSTSGLGKGLYVYAYQHDSDKNLIYRKKTACRADGSFSLQFLASELIINNNPDINNPVELFVYQGGTQLGLVGNGNVEIRSIQPLYLKNLFIASRSSVSGVVKRQNYVNAAGCLIELYRDTDNDSSTATLIDGAKAFTNINGEYKIPYSGNEKNSLRLKFYNNEDVLSEFVSTDPSILGDTAAEITTEVVNASGNYSEGEWFEVITETNSKIYEYVSDASEIGKVNASLVSWVDESTPFEKLFYRRVLNEDNNKYYRVLDKKVVYHSDGKVRETYTRIPENVTSGQLILHNHYIETYNSYWSPQLVTSKQKEEVNFLFENNTLDEYTRIINREEEFIPASATADSTTPTRSLIKGYSVDDTPNVASLIGVSEEDIQDLSQARDFKSQMRLDDFEEVLFGLVKAGVKLDVAIFFSMSDTSLTSTIQESIDEGVIPSVNISVALTAIKDRLLDVVTKEFTEVFTGIESNAVKSVMADAKKKDAFIRAMAQFSYDNSDLSQELDGDFWLALNLGDAEEEQLRFAIQYSEVCNANEKFVNRFLEDGALKPFSGLLEMTKGEIQAEITPEVLASDDMPEGITTVEAYSDFIYNQIEDKFATESLLFDLAKPGADFAIEGDTVLSDMFNALRVKLIETSMSSSTHFYGIVDTAGSTFNIEKGPVRDFLETDKVNNELSTFYSGLGAYSKQDWIRFMTIIQRVYSITSEGKYETIKALIDNAYLSAYDIVKAGRNKFINKMNGVLEKAVCLKLYRSAEYKVNQALAILNKYSGSANSGMPVVITDKTIESGDEKNIKLLSLPEMSMLFGDQDVTDTKHGESVLGPAAYLVDVLNVLKQFKVSDTKDEITLYDKLIKRRPDIAEIPLNCTNALTPLPYIDLVMEILESTIYYHENGHYLINKWDTTKTEEQLKTDPEYTQYAVYDSIKKNTITSWLSKPFDLFSEELKLYAKTLGINRTKLAEPYYTNIEGAVNPYFDVLGMTSEELVLFPENSSNTNADLNFVINSIFGENPDPVPTKLPVKDFLEKSIMTLDEFNDLIGSYYVNPFVTDGENYQRFTIHYSGKQELSTAYLDFGSTDRLKAFLMRMFQFRRLTMLTEWSTPVLDAILLLNSKYKAYYDTINSNNPLITSVAVENLGKAKMNQEYLGMSDDQVASVFGKAVVLEYDKNSSFISQTFIDNDLPEEHKETLKELLTIGNKSEVPSNAAAFNAEGKAHVFMEYLQEAMNLDDDELFALSSLLELDNNLPKLTARGIQNMITAWQLAEGYGLKIEEFLAYCKLIQFDVTTALVDSVETLSNAQKTVIANQTNVMELLFLLQHHGSAEELEEFEKRANKIVANILDKKDEFSPVLEEGQQMSQEQKDALALALQPVIEEQLNITTKLELPFVSKVLEQKSIDGKDVANYTADPGIDEASVVETKLLVAIKSCLKSLSLSEEMNINLEDLAHIDSSPVNIFNLPMDSAQTVSYEDFAKLAAVCQAKQFLLDGKNGFDFYHQILSTDKANLALSNYIDWHAILTDWQHNDELETNKYNSNLKWFLQAGEINQFLNRYGIQSADALKLIKWKWTNVAEAEQSVKSITKLAQEKANAAVYKAEMSTGRDQLRMKQRDALVHYLFEKKSEQFTDIYDLYSYFMIDTQMTPAVASSRILQATLTVQSFIKRIQLGLETDIAFTKEDAKKWEWMSLYRVWEANRKIFLYPENWLEPELRDNKTPFFKDLEKDLTGKEITKETVNDSYMDYISKFEQVANIEICQLYNEEHDNFSVLHVIGRSRFEPREYFYRKLVNESYWTPWEKMGVEINSEHIAPAIIKDRLVAFWLECTDSAKKPTDEDLSIENPSEGETIKPKSAQKQLEMKVCWSELIDNKWTRKRTCEDKVLEVNSETDLKFTYRLVFDNGDKKYLHILNNPSSNRYKNKGTSFSVECFNHVHLTKLGRFSGQDYIMPQGMKTHGQKAQMMNSKKWLSLPVAATNGIGYTKNVVENINGHTRLVYPHQYQNFISNAPFVVETNLQSVVFIPRVKAERSSVILKKVIRYTFSEPKLRPRRRYYHPEHHYPYYEDRYYRDERYYYRGNRYDDRWRREERYEYRMPYYFTQEHEDLCIVKKPDINREVTYELVNVGLLLAEPLTFKPEMIAGLAYHPYMESLRSNLQRYGIDGILDPLGIADKDHQLLPQQANRSLLKDFELNSDVVKNVLVDSNPDDSKKYIAEKFEYDLAGAYSIYNWEIFFHIPFMLANRFLIEGNYEEALRWMHYIFDPRETEGKGVSRFWKFKPFADYNATKGIEDLLYDLNMEDEQDPANVELNKQIEMWSSDPFKPHNVAQMRPGAYMKAVVMRYLDIIIAHGDNQFRIDTTESINEAMQYYMIAGQLLGRKPEVLETKILAPKTYGDMNSDGMSNAIEYFEEGLIKPENAAYFEKYVESNELEIASKPFSKEKDQKGMLTDVYGAMEHDGDVAKLYFGIPKNDKLLAYWDRVADRLFKIRHSLNIDGIKRTVALFAPPIDPGLLIRARQAGISIGEVMTQKDANPTEYRFQTLLQRALEICGEVKSLGSQLLSALEKGETEKISLLRAKHEKSLTDQVTGIKEKNIDEAEESIEQLKLQQENTQFREKYYRKKKKISGKEQQQLNFMDKAMKLQVASQAMQLLAGSTNLLPDVEAGANGFGGSPLFTVKYGGEKASNTGTILASAMSMLGSIASHKGSKAGIIASYERRKQDWNFQADTAKRELELLKQQEVSAEIRKEIAKLDLRNHETQVKQTQESFDVLSSKFTNEQLYLTLAKDISNLYRSAFEMAFEMAKQAEGAYNFELCPDKPRLPLPTNLFDAQYKGLLAGEKLFMELKKMEADYLTNNKRKFELTKHVSFAMLDPQKILDLRNGGTCSVNLPEILFDLDHPGHINRRIKSVSLTIPCVAGAYTSISADLSLKSSSIVTDDQGTVFSPKKKITRMATSSAVNDSGLFELNFNDARYLPFEGAGAASEWVITLPNNIRQFDYNSINDVILHINYTAEDAGNRTAVENNLVSKLNDMVKDADLASMFSLKAQYPEAWAKVGSEDVTIEIKKSQLPFYLQGQNINITGSEGTILSGKDQVVQALSATTGTMGTSHSVTIPADANVSNADDLMIVLKYTVS
ncbi:neuraminidase-like domain-containing protein [Marinifilum fragile]|uniref:Tc toxin subunit A-related protein n=1 Tax=Marinifilum fragile TaxID=570161 RepID=UPI002AAC0351|nr:neuraminidase-like domain-containing protein [Marinifilum fragile]